MNSTFKRNTVNAIDLKLQLINLTVKTSKLLLIHAMSYMSAILSTYLTADSKVGELHI